MRATGISDNDLDLWLDRIAGEYLGGGLYSEAFALKSDPSKVVKVSRRNRTPDMAASLYLEMCRVVRPDHGPVVFNNWHFTTPCRDVTVSILERLVPVDFDLSAGLRSRLTQAIDASYDPNVGEFTAQIDPTQYVLPCEARLFRCILRTLNHSRNYFPDLHAGNAMARADGTVIITDPVAGA